MLPVEKVVARLFGSEVVDAARRARVSFVSVQPVNAAPVDAERRSLRDASDTAERLALFGPYRFRLQQSGEINRPAMDALAARLPAGSVILIARHGQREVEYK